MAGFTLTKKAPAQHMGWVEAFRISFVSGLIAIPAIAGAYLVKSALGINLMAGPSPLHDLLYRFVS